MSSKPHSRLSGNGEKHDNPDTYYERFNITLPALESSLRKLTSVHEIPIKLPDAVSTLTRVSKPGVLHHISDNARQAFWSCLCWLHTSGVAENSTAVQQWTVRILHNCLSNSTNPAVEGRITSSPVLLPELAKYLRTQVGLGKRPKSALCALVLLAAERALCQNRVTSVPLGTELVRVMASLTSCGTVGETDSSRLISACVDWISAVPVGHSSIVGLLEECPALLERLILQKLLKCTMDRSPAPNSPLPSDVAECFADLAKYGSTSPAVHCTTASVLINLYHESSENELVLAVIKTYLRNLHVYEMEVC
ncbi:unnamed protein product [Ixodes pacificus]